MIEENSGPAKNVPISEVSHLVSVPLNEVIECFTVSLSMLREGRAMYWFSQKQLKPYYLGNFASHHSYQTVTISWSRCSRMWFLFRYISKLYEKQAQSQGMLAYVIFLFSFLYFISFYLFFICDHSGKHAFLAKSFYFTRKILFN